MLIPLQFTHIPEFPLLDAGHSLISTSTDTYRLAKIEHYLRRAEQCFQMSRYSAASETLKAVLKLDPANSGADSLSKRISYQLSLLQRQNGYAIGGHEGRSSREIVMVVDQDERILIRLSETLRKYGCEVVSALNEREARETAGLITPDLVISEVNFENGPAGMDLFLWLRSHPPTQRAPFLFLATRIDRDLLIAGRRLGVDDFLLKPMDEAVVAAAVINCLKRSRKPVS